MTRTGYSHAERSILKDLGGNIRAARKAKGLSQEQLAFACSLDRTYIGGVERGERNIAALNIVRIAAALHVSAADLFKGLASPR